MDTSKDTENGSKEEKNNLLGSWGKLNGDNNCVMVFK